MDRGFDQTSQQTMAQAAPMTADSAPRWSDLRYPLLDLVPPNVAASASKVCVFADGSNVIIVTKEDDVYVIGNNTKNCLGIKEYRPPHVVKNNALCGKGICQIAVSPSTTFVLANTRDGAVYSWGRKHHALGNGQSGAVPSLVEFGQDTPIIHVSCGNDHAMAVDALGQVFAWGNGSNYQLGFNNTSHQPTPACILANIKVSTVSCCSYSNFAIDQKGQLHVWGHNNQNLLMIVGNNQNVGAPAPCTHLNKKSICQVAIGASHALFLADDGEAYSIGANTYGQLGYPGAATNVPKVINFENKGVIAKEVSASPNGNTSAALLSDGSIYIWGQCYKYNYDTPTKTYLSSVQSALSSASIVQNSCGTIHLIMEKTSLSEDNLAKAFQDQLTSDMVFMVEGKKIYAHQAVLQIRCQYFRKSYVAEVKEKRQVAVTEYSYEVYRAFIEYLYTEKITISPDAAVNLLDLASTYNEPPLKLLCVELIQRDVTASNVAAVYAASVKFNAKDLEDFCARFTAHNMAAVCQSVGFATLDKPVLLSLLAKCQHLGGFSS